MDEKLILTLIDKFSAGNIGELDLAEGSSRLVLRKNAAPAAAGPSAGSETVHLGIPAVLTSTAPAGSSAENEYITSPIVGTFYAAASPDAPSFVRAGSKVKAGDTLCILEAMKMMNHLEAEFDSEIVSVKAASGDLVEFGQELFEVKRLG
ncbi:acetyl-CoA carboxylase biotin carboxyl carrier protein subunit [Spirochaetia bacterium]|nr:acetyl-CoA carboxylase biotin carboxyl carrier protein subunit [Spirochaetia bacterium]